MSLAECGDTGGRAAGNLRERAHAVLGHHAYRCVDCGRRFLDRPLARATPGPPAG